MSDASQPDASQPDASQPDTSQPDTTQPDTSLPKGYVFKPEWELTPLQTKALMDARTPGLIVLDCRRQEEWETTRIAGTVLIPMSEIERRADELESDQGGRDHPIVVHCHHGVRSLKVTATLRALGFSDVKSMAGGIDAWSTGVDQRVARY